MKIKNVKVGIVAAAIVVGAGALGGGVFYYNSTGRRASEERSASALNTFSKDPTVARINSGGVAGRFEGSTFEISLEGSPYKFVRSQENIEAIKSLRVISDWVSVRISRSTPEMFVFSSDSAINITDKKVSIDYRPRYEEYLRRCGELGADCWSDQAHSMIIQYRSTKGLSNIKITSDDGMYNSTLNRAMSGSIRRTEESTSYDETRNFAIDPINISAVERTYTQGSPINIDDLVNKSGNNYEIAWKTPINNNRTGRQTGVVTVTHTTSLGLKQIVDLPVSAIIEAPRPTDNTPPTFNPQAPAKITSRKGAAINISDVQANDPESTVTSFTNNATAIGLNPANPAAGNYTLRYSATNQNGLSSNVDRQIEITDADALIAKLREARNVPNLDRATASSRQALNDKIQQAQNAINNNSTPQAELDRLVRELNTAIAGVSYDKTALQNLVNSVPNEKQAVRQDAEVVRALNNANAILGKNNATPQEIDSAKQQLEDALRNARNRVAAQEEAERQRQAEVARQNDARRAVEHARQTLDGGDVNTAKQKVALIQDDTVKNELNGKIREIEELIAKRNELENAIRRGEQADVNGKTQTSRDALTGAINQGKQKLADKTTNIDEITRRIQAINDAINGLKVDKTALQESIRGAENQPDHIKEAIRNELNNAKAVDGNNGATVQDVQNAKDALDRAIQDAIRLEQGRQNTARGALDNAKRDVSPESIRRAQDAINQIKDPAVRNTLQNELNGVKNSLEDVRNRLLDLIRLGKNTSTDGKTTDTVNRLQNSIRDAERILQGNGANKGDIEREIVKLQNAINGLKTDKAPLVNAIREGENHPDYVKNNDEVKKFIDIAKNINNQDNPSVEDIQNTIRDLNNAINNAIQDEKNRQQMVDDMLDDAEREIKDNLSKKDELPIIDIEKIKTAINDVQDLVKKEEFKNRLNEIENSIEKKRLQIDEDKRLEAERKLREEIERQRREAEERARLAAKSQSPEAPNTGHGNNGGLFATVLAGFATILSATVVFFKKK